ncbi:hypothetical protein EYZ11_003668 [Aspergillus tanneri]|uniref:Uncharacterized protein n=1 Tax=Aspergillus tanneri TaxID=1220188 RepID=A0A4V6RQW3_9EURO|nr:hypothetical protein EYZ11_003668 [Aspergillus tanneri]
MAVSTGWLSNRVRSNVERMLPGITSALIEKDKSAIIDLATAENHVIREELINVYKEVLNEKLVPQKERGRNK